MIALFYLRKPISNVKTSVGTHVILWHFPLSLYLVLENVRKKKIRKEK